MSAACAFVRECVLRAHARVRGAQAGRGLAGGGCWRIHARMAYLLKYPVAEAHGGIWIRARPAGGSAVIPRDIRNDVCQSACSAGGRWRKCWSSVSALSARRREQERRHRQRPCDVHCKESRTFSECLRHTNWPWRMCAEKPLRADEVDDAGPDTTPPVAGPRGNLSPACVGASL